jgi:putative endonuclease
MMVKLTKIVVRALEALAGQRARNPERLPEHLVTGKRGEDAAYFHLRELGYVMVARNWRSRRRKGEIDLIGWDGDVLCFIEVKTRSTRDVKPAEAAVDREKQSELRAMAREYLWRMSRGKNASSDSATDRPRQSSHLTSQRICRFDVVSIYYERERHEVTEITLFRNSFAMA